MQNPRLKALPCKISRGGFSDERVFHLNFLDVECEGVASRSFFWKEDGSELPEGEPPIGETISGLIAARIVAIERGNSALVSIPDGAVIRVSVQDLKERPSEVGAHVPIRP